MTRNANLETVLRSLHDDLAALRARLAESEAREQALREALLAYGAHLPLCNRRLYPGQGYLCQCGWDAARLLGFAAAQPATAESVSVKQEGVVS